MHISWNRSRLDLPLLRFEFDSMNYLAPLWVTKEEEEKTFCQLTIDMFTLSSSYKWLLLFSAICQFWLGICFAKTTFKNQSMCKNFVNKLEKLRRNIVKLSHLIYVVKWSEFNLDWSLMLSFFKYLPQILLMLSQKLLEVADSFFCRNVWFLKKKLGHFLTEMRSDPFWLCILFCKSKIKERTRYISF